MDPQTRRAAESLLKAFPQRARKAIDGALREAMTRTKNRGIRLANSEYAITPQGRKRVAAQAIMVMSGEMGGELIFKGRPGAPLRWFATNPKRGVQHWQGQSPHARKPREGVMAKRRKAGQMHPAYGPHGEKSFWIKGNGGNVVLVYRPLGTQRISTDGLMGPSPIQAIVKAENAAALQEYAAETLQKRVDHAIQRILNGH